MDYNERCERYDGESMHGGYVSVKSMETRLSATSVNTGIGQVVTYARTKGFRSTVSSGL